MFHVTDHTMRTDTGRKRSGNEDSAYVRVPLFMIADGMGGAQAGEVASQIVQERFAPGLPDGAESAEQRLASMISGANAAIYAAASSDETLAGMGTTCTAAFLGDEDLAIAHVGDSRCYRLRGGVLEQLTDDHSLVGELVRRGQLTEQEAEDHPQRSIITRALGIEPEVPVDHFTVSVQDGDLYLLCSDGLTDMVPDVQIAELLRGEAPLVELADGLVSAANVAGGRDNITVVAFRVAEVELGGGAANQATGTHDAVAAPSPEPAAPRTAPAPATPPQADQPRQGSGKPAAVAVALILTVFLVLASAGWIATRSVSFVGTNDEGFVTLYQGVPYTLPGLSLYQEQYVSGLPADRVPSADQRLLTDHELRSQKDAVDLIRQLEQGTLDRQS